MWGLSIQFWQAVVSWANVVAFVCAVLTGAALFLSAYVSSNISDIIQGDADRRIAEARTRGDEARAQAAEANERASAAAERAATLEKEAAEARLKLAQITMPRHLTPEHVETLKPLLMAIPSKGKVVVKGRWPGEEALTFTQQISGIMSDAGFDVVETPSAQHVLSLGNVGVNIIVRDINNAPPAASAVQAAFKQVGLEMPGISDPNACPEADVFWIMIGSRY
jgi:hypothetical protein